MQIFRFCVVCKLILILILQFSAFASAANKPQIITSITPIASIVAMLVKDKAEITTISNNNDCPHHYHLKPSDVNKVKKADLAIYIDDQFDNFATKLLQLHNKNILKISEIPSLNLIKHNWHLWLDLQNVQIILKELSIVLAKNFPTISEDIFKNYLLAVEQINNLERIKAFKLSHISDVILLDDSLEYFCQDVPTKIQYLYSPDQKSLRYIDKVKILLAQSQSKCLVLSANSNIKIYQNLQAKIISLESENWSIPDIDINEHIFYDKYLQMVTQLDRCLSF